MGSGIMSTTLAVLLRKRNPESSIRVVEAAREISPESSDAWNNAGTGHAGICELSYTPFRDASGGVDVGKAISIFAEFEKSLQFWGSSVAEGVLGDPRSFLNPLPHVSFVHGAEQVDFLRGRYDSLRKHHFFREMRYSEDREQIAEWAPLLTAGRPEDEPIAATWQASGTDMNFGEIARQFAEWLADQPGCEVRKGERVVGLERIRSGWEVVSRHADSGEESRVEAGFVFLGAGGATLPLLQQARVEETRGYGGFPVGGQWLVCRDPAIVDRHTAKVYGQPQGEAPTMAVPHLDTRVIGGERALLFGPFASWTTKFLRHGGHWTDLPASIRPDNILPLLNVARKEWPLVGYLIREGLQSMEDRIELLRCFYPEADASDWMLEDAGIRVQAIKKEDGETGIVHFGTEVLHDESRTLAALLGASPGASVSVDVMLKLIGSCFGPPEESEGLASMIPSLRSDLTAPESAELFETQRAETNRRLGLA